MTGIGPGCGALASKRWLGLDLDRVEREIGCAGRCVGAVRLRGEPRRLARDGRSRSRPLAGAGMGLR